VIIEYKLEPKGKAPGSFPLCWMVIARALNDPENVWKTGHLSDVPLSYSLEMDVTVTHGTKNSQQLITAMSVHIFLPDCTDVFLYKLFFTCCLEDSEPVNFFELSIMLESRYGRHTSGLKELFFCRYSHSDSLTHCARKNDLSAKIFDRNK
jgi:hypothetical protein